MKKSIGPYAEFGIIEDFDRTKNYMNYEPEKYNCISIPDDVIDNWWSALTQMKSYSCCFDRPTKALDRWGITLIPPESLDLFYNVIKIKTSPLFERRIPNELSDLLTLVKKAKDEEKYIIHFGV